MSTVPATPLPPPHPRPIPGSDVEEPEFVDEPDLPGDGKDDDAPNPNRVMHPADLIYTATSSP